MGKRGQASLHKHPRAGTGTGTGAAPTSDHKVIHIGPNDKLICALCGKPIAFSSLQSHTKRCAKQQAAETIDESSDDDNDNDSKSVKHRDRKIKATTSKRKPPPKQSPQNKPQKKSRKDNEEQTRTSLVARMPRKDDDDEEEEQEQEEENMESFQTQLAALNPVLPNKDARIGGKDHTCTVWDCMSRYRHILYWNSAHVECCLYC
jgi:hypothetical protein